MAATLAQLGFDIRTDEIKDATKSLGNLDKQSGKTEQSASKFSRGYSKSMDVAKKSALAMSAAAIGVSAAILKYTNDGLENIDVLAKLARAQGATADGIRAVQIAAGDAGLDGMAASLTRLTRRLGAAEMGNKEYGDTVKALGLNIADLSKLDADKKVGAIADAVQSSGLSMEETARHLQNLGFEQSNANAFFRAGGDAVRNARGEVQSYGLSLSAIDTAKVEAANDAWSRTALSTEAATNQLAVSMTPVIQTVAQYLNDAAKEGDGFGEAIERGVQTGVEAFAYLADVAHSIETVFQVAGKAIAAEIIWLVGDVKQSIGAIVTNTVSGINYIIDAANMIGGSFDRIEVPSFAADMIRDSKLAEGAVAAAVADIHETLMKEPPSGGILKHYEKVKKAAHESAKVAVAAEKKASKERADIADTGGNKTGDEFAKSFESSTKSIASSLQDSIITGDWAGLGATVGGALAGGIAASVSDSMATSLGTIGAGFAGAIAGGLAGLAIQKITEFMGDDYDPTEKRQASQGTGTVLGSINEKTRSIEKASDLTALATNELVGINRSMLRALEQVNIGISGASTRVAKGTGYTGAAAGVGSDNAFDKLINANLDFASALTLGLVDFGSMFGGSSKKKDEGIQIIGGYISDLVDETLVDAYATFRTRKNSWSKSKTKERTSSLGEDAGNQFALVFDSILDSVIAGASTFGIDSSAADSFKVSTQKLSLEGLDAGQRQAAIEEYFGTVFDNLAAHTIPWLDSFQMAGEGLGETLARVATNVQVTEQAVSQLGFQFASLAGEDLAEASTRLVELSGGVEQFISSMSGFISNFASETQQFEIAQNSLASAFEQTNLALPETRQGYYDLMQAQDGATEAGAENIAALLRLQSHASKYYDTLEEGAEKAIQSARSMAESNLSQSMSAANAVNNALSGLSQISNPQSQQSALDSILRMTASGNIGNTSDLQGTLSAATSINASDFATFNEYIRTVSKTGAALGGLKQITDSKVTKDQQLLSNIEKEIALMSGELIKLSEANVKQSAKSARILERIEVGGIEVKA